MNFWRRPRKISEYKPGEMMPLHDGMLSLGTKIDMDEATKQALLREVREMLSEKIDLLLQDMITPAIEARLREMLKVSRREGATELAGQILAELFKREGN